MITPQIFSILSKNDMKWWTVVLVNQVLNTASVQHAFALPHLLSIFVFLREENIQIAIMMLTFSQSLLSIQVVAFKWHKKWLYEWLKKKAWDTFTYQATPA